RHVLGAPDRALEEVAELDAGDLLRERLEAVLGDADPGRAITAPELAHDVVETRRRAAAQLEIERERDERTLDVVADVRVRRVRLRLIKHIPRVEARIGQRLSK